MSESHQTDFIKIAKTFTFITEHDYQQDKPTPIWHREAQPGPTYFMSHDTNYVHIIVSESLGEASDEKQKTDTSESDTEEATTASKFGRNKMYIRSQALMDESYQLCKDSNDTISTYNHFLSGAPSTGYEPSVFRTGYDADGKLDLA